MADTDNKSAAELEREVAAQRSRVESTIDQIQERLSPGQLVDEVLSYTKAGGGEFAANLGRTISANPVPVALLGVSLAWLIARPGGAPDRHPSDRDWDRRFAARDNRGNYEDYGSTHYQLGDYGRQPRQQNRFAKVTGSALQRVGDVTGEAGETYSEFIDDAGKKFRALRDDVGNRAGHFMDEAGETYHGFVDEAGNRVAHFRDEAGNLLHEASGWASENWGMVQERMNDMRDEMGRRAHDLRDQAMHAGQNVQNQAQRAGRTVANFFEEQPLVGGALAFAVGAAIASALPRTQQEDRLLGEASDQVKARAGQVAGEAYAKGKEQARHLYEDASEKAVELYEDAKAGVASIGETARTPGQAKPTAS